MAFTGAEHQQAWPPSDPVEREREWSQPASPWTYNNDGPNPGLMPSNSDTAQHLRSRKHVSASISAVPPYHPDYEPAQHEYDDGDDGERFAEYEMGRRAAAHVRCGSEGYEVRPIDREQLLAEFIAGRGQEAGHYQRYVPEPPSEPESGGEEVEVEEVHRERDDYDDDDEEPLSVRVEKWRSGEAIS
jgi:palmitoyltransferase ZDHHC6